MPTQPTIGTRVRERRQKLGLDQSELARRSGLSRPFLTQIETGRRSPSLSAFRRLAEALQCSLDDLGSAEISPAPKSHKRKTTPKASRAAGPRPASRRNGAKP